MSSGKIVQIIGAVLDVEFPSDAIPNIYDALIVEGEALVPRSKYNNNWATVLLEQLLWARPMVYSVGCLCEIQVRRFQFQSAARLLGAL